MSIIEIPSSPTGEIDHNAVRVKVNELVIAANVIRPVYATMAITQRDATETLPNTISVIGTGNDVLNPPLSPVTAGPGPFGGYYRIGAFIEEGETSEIVISGDEMILPNDGVYMVPVAWAGFRHSSNNATVAFVIGIERAGQIIFSQRPTSSRQPNGGDIENVSGGGQLPGVAGDKISGWLASDITGDVTVGNANFTIFMLKDTSI